ncbi:protein of unknown function [Streptomyces murinus]
MPSHRGRVCAFIVRLSPYDTIVLSMRRVGGQAGRQWPHRKVSGPRPCPATPGGVAGQAHQPSTTSTFRGAKS